VCEYEHHLSGLKKSFVQMIRDCSCCCFSGKILSVVMAAIINQLLFQMAELRMCPHAAFQQKIKTFEPQIESNETFFKSITFLSNLPYFVLTMWTFLHTCSRNNG